MLEFLNINLKTIVGFRFSGELTAADVDEIVNVFEARLSGSEIVNFYAEIEPDSDDAAVTVQARKLFGSVLPNLHRLQKVALVTDDRKLRMTARIENHSFASEMKSFSFAEKRQARDWAQTMETDVDIFER